MRRLTNAPFNDNFMTFSACYTGFHTDNFAYLEDIRVSRLARFSLRATLRHCMSHEPVAGLLLARSSVWQWYMWQAPIVSAIPGILGFSPSFCGLLDLFPFDFTPSEVLLVITR
jgi:hypothetical protein